MHTSIVGPFLIVAQSRVGPLVYLSIDLASMTLQATTSKHQAKPFIIMASEENANDFHIVYINVRGNSHRSSLSPLFSSHPTGYRPLPHYLTAHRNIFGYSSEPLRLEINPPFQDTLFHLHSRLRTSRPPPEDPGPWVTGKEAFFISCSTRWFARDAYIAVRREVLGGKSTSIRIQDIVIAVVSSAVTFALLRWCALAMRHFNDRYLMTAERTAELVDEALAKGLLPKSYVRSPDRDRRVAKTIRYDRKLGFSEAEIEKDLEAYLPD